MLAYPAGDAEVVRGARRIVVGRRRPKGRDVVRNELVIEEALVVREADKGAIDLALARGRRGGRCAGYAGNGEEEPGWHQRRRDAAGAVSPESMQLCARSDRGCNGQSGEKSSGHYKTFRLRLVLLPHNCRTPDPVENSKVPAYLL